LDYTFSQTRVCINGVIHLGFLRFSEADGTVAGEVDATGSG
jgi:hypothetical protein